MKSTIETLLTFFQLSEIQLLIVLTSLLILLLFIGFPLLFYRLKCANDSVDSEHSSAAKLMQKLELLQQLHSKDQQQLQHSINGNHQQSSLALSELKHLIDQRISDMKIKLLTQQGELAEKQLSAQHQYQQQFNQNQLKSVDQLVEHLTKASALNREEQRKSLSASSEQIAEKMKELTAATDNKLKEISDQVEKRLTDGFDKTTKTFNDILKRLALIDDAQKKITELSSNVVSLQEVLADKRSRGAFGEVQLNSLIRNVLPEQHFSLQHTLSNGKIADCVLFLPEPTGTVVIDAKFPLESYRKMTDIDAGDMDRKAAERQFKADIKKHIKDISEKYLIEKETADGAIMFLPAEAIFAEIHGHYPELVELANQQRVWLTSPTTLMAILTTARAVIKDEATREQVHIIQAHLAELAGDFGRFRTRFNNLAKHIDQAAGDVKQIHTSADKIANRFSKIEQVELQKESESQLSEAKLSVN